MSDIPPRSLRETLGRSLSPPPASGCIDAEMLAAWSDGTLSSRDRTAMESHASSCARCQALVAAMARMAPPAARRRWWHPSMVPWLMPLGAAVAILFLIVVPGLRHERAATPSSQLSSAAPRADASASTAIAPSAPATAPSASAREATPVAPRARTSPSATAGDRAVAKKEVPQPAQALAEKDARDVAPAPAPSAAAAPAEARAVPPSESTLATRGAASQGDAPRPSPAASTSDRVSQRIMGFAAKAIATPTDIVSPDREVRWRILTGGDVARSTDFGLTWQTQSTGVTATLTAGVATSSTTCWLVGTRGTIVISTDGSTWQRVPFPEAFDLGSIATSGATSVTVTATNGRRFTTTDGGKTWR